MTDTIAPDRDPSIFPEGTASAAHARGGAGGLAGRVGALLRQAVWQIWVNQIAAWSIWPGRIRRIMLNAAGMDIRTNGISAHCHFTNADVQVGAFSYINEGFYGDARGGILLGERVGLGPRVMIITSTHKRGPARQRTGAHVAKRVTIGDGSAVAAGAQIHAGVTLGRGTIVAAGSVVFRSIRAGRLASGVPAKEIYDYADVDD
ncbi:MAG: acyltransferase [Dermatophilus congolensis]|nr:acyltransferase [Dermatophilus congolensis]